MNARNFYRIVALAGITGLLSGCPARSGQQAQQEPTKEPTKEAKPAEKPAAKGCHLGRDPVCHMKVEDDGDDLKVTHEGKTYCFCNETDRDGFKKDPKKYLSPEWQQHPRMLRAEEVR